MSNEGRLAKRIEELEIQLAHLQRTCEQLNEVVTDQANIIDQMNGRVGRLDSMVSDLKQASEESGDPLDEKPPHY